MKPSRTTPFRFILSLSMVLCAMFALAAPNLVTDDWGTFKASLWEHMSDPISLAEFSPIIQLNNYAGVYEKQLYRRAINSLEIAGDIRIIRNVKSKLQMTDLEVGDALRPYNPKEQIRGTVNYKPRLLEVELWKREEAFEIKKYHGEWLEMELAKAEGSSSQQKTIPFAKYTWDAIFESLKAEINDKTAYFGFDKTLADPFDPLATYDAGEYMTRVAADGIEDFWLCVADTTAGQTPETHAAKWKLVNAEAVNKGLGTILQKDITAGRIVPETIGALSSSGGSYDAFTEIYRSHPDRYRTWEMTAFCSYTDHDLLLDDLEGEITKYTMDDLKKDAGRGFYLPKTGRKLKILPCSWMNGSRRILTTPSQNLILGYDRDDDMTKAKIVQSELWTDKYGISGTLGLMIRDPKVVRCNDQV